jgi:phosphatidylinositol alpha-mannosyltransferase
MKNSTNLKIGIVLDDSLDRSENGVQQYVRTLGGWLAKQGHTVHYLVGDTKTGNADVHSLSRNIAVRFNQNRLTIPLPANKTVIKNLLAREKYDVLHVQMPYSPFLAGKIISAAPDSMAIVGTFHILPFGRLQKVGSKTLGLAQKATLKRFDAICSVSPAAAEFAKSHFGLESIVIPNMIDTSVWRSAVQPHPGRIVYLGRLVPRKGCQELLTALAKLPDDLLQKIEVLIASDGPERAKLEKFAASNKLHNVSFLGFIDESSKADLLASAEIAVFPSLGGESFGIVLIEAMAAGSGVVLGGNNPGYASVLGAWQKTLIEPTNPESFARSLELFLTDKNQRLQIHAEQQQAVLQYDVNLAGKKIVNMYNQALLHRSAEMR